MRWVVIALLLAACSGADRSRVERTAPGKLAPPGLRLPDTVTPLAYDLELDIDPDSEIFKGEVTIDVRLERASDVVWLHADQLSITTATWTGGTLTPLPVAGEQMRAYSFGRTVAAGTTKLRFAFTGRTTGDQEGLFRQREGAWYVFSQGEAVFARRITPCFDEPRWKTPWRVRLIVPKRQVALANMPEASTTVLSGNRKQIVYAETPPMPTYLLALAVGPFDLVDAGTVGRNKIPVRVAVRQGEGKNVGVVAARLPAVVTYLEDYLDDALPVAKLDLVGVPQFFGAMENPGLITFHEQILIGNHKRDGFADYFTYIAAHELVHQWFGNLVTPAWWDHLWLSEAFASWLGDKVVAALDGYDDEVLRRAMSRREAIDADGDADAKPLLRHVTTTAGADEGFDSIAYAKGQVVLATFEHFIGHDAFRDRVRAYIKAHRGKSVTSDDLIPALATGEQGDAFKRFVASRGTPVVHFELKCPGRDAKPELFGHAKTPVPVCVTYGAAKTGGSSCALVGATTSIPVGDTCPAWVLGNPHGGYYHVGWLTHGPRGPAPPRAETRPLARITAGDDLAAAVDRGELPAAAAVAELRALAESNDVYAQLGAVALAHAIDPLVDDATRTAWTAWLAARFGERLAYDKKPPVPAEGELVQALIRVLPADAFATAVTRRAHDVVDKLVTMARTELPPYLVGLAAPHGGDKLFERIVTRSRALRDDDTRAAWLETLGELGAAQAVNAVALVIESELEPEVTWPAVARFLERPATRTAAWNAIKAQLPALRRRMSTAQLEQLFKDLGQLCDPALRDEVAVTLRGDKHLTTTLQPIEHCIERRTKLGDLAAALAR